VLFFPVQQELDCISDSGDILGKIKFDHAQSKHVFTPADKTIKLSDSDKSSLEQRLAGLDSGQYTIPMDDDD